MKVNSTLANAAIALTVVLTLGSGYLYAHIRHTAGLGMDLTERAEELESLPTEIGDWRLVEDRQLDENVADMLECAGQHFAVYQDTQGNIATVVVILGPAGPTAVHTPEICFSAQAFRVIEDKKPMKLKSNTTQPSNLWLMTFESKGIDRRQLKVAYGWTTDGTWQNPNSSRRAFAGSPFLYKVQLSMSFPESSTEEEHIVFQEFCQDFTDQIYEIAFR